MIAIAASASVDSFESLLDKTVEHLRITLRAAPSMGSMDFEDTVWRAMVNVAKGTPFQDKVFKTKPGAFPDITADGYYGVEAKQVQKNKTQTTGNSIFESTRVVGVEDVYLVMSWNVAEVGQEKVGWRRYAESISSVVISHSPRYLLDIELPNGKSLFDKVGIEYNDFRRLERQKMMDQVRGIYAQKGSSDLWWIDARQDNYRRPYTRFEDAPTSIKNRLIGEAFLLCPNVFSKSRRYKYEGVMAYWLSHGYLSHSLRDHFTAGGKMQMGDHIVPQIFIRARDHKDDILRAGQTLDEDTIKHFWKAKSLPPRSEIIREWLFFVSHHYRGLYKHVDMLENILGVRR